MADKFIDLDETQIYGAHAARNIPRHVAELVPEFKAGMMLLADEVAHVTDGVRRALEAARQAGAALRQQTAPKGSLLTQATRYLGRFSRHLDGHPQGSLDRRTFFPEDGTATAVGRSAPRVLLALQRVQQELARPGSPVRDAAAWGDEARTLTGLLAPMLEHAHHARTERLTATPELEAARQAWMQTYSAAKSGVACVLRLRGRLHLMPVVFHDLAVPALTKLTEAPPDLPVEAPVKDDPFATN